MKNDGIAQGFFLQTVGLQLFPWTAYPPVTTFSPRADLQAIRCMGFFFCGVEFAWKGELGLTHKHTKDASSCGEHFAHGSAF